MHDKHIWQLPLATLTGVFLLSVLWEFLIEPVIAPLLPGDYRDESARERWEYVVTNVVFAALALAVPMVLLVRSEVRRRRALASVQASEKRYRILYEANPCMLITVDANCNVRAINEFGARQLGYWSGELEGKPITALAPQGLGDDFRGKLHSYMEAPDTPHYFEAAMQRSDGTVLWARHAACIINDPDGQPLLLLVSEDITAERERSERLSHEASHDALTGLVNRRELERRLSRALVSAREGPAEHVLAYLDLDGFKAVNDTYGHMAGDRVLYDLARLLKARVRTRDTLARIGGDEFVVLMEHCGLPQAERVARDMLAAVQNCRLFWGEHPLRIGASIGVVAVTGNSAEAQTVLNAADAACYAAKQRGGNRLYVEPGPQETSSDPSQV